MNRYEKICGNVYALDLYSGKIAPKRYHNSHVFYIVEHTNDSEYIKSEAMQMIVAFGQTEYHFYGKYEKEWHLAFDEADMLVYESFDDVSMTIGHETIEEMAEILISYLHERPFVPCDYYIIYDDKVLYNQLKKILISNFE